MEKNGTISTKLYNKEIDNNLIEHYDMTFKAPSPDGIKNELLRAMAENDICLKTITKWIINWLNQTQSQ